MRPGLARRELDDSQGAPQGRLHRWASRSTIAMLPEDYERLRAVSKKESRSMAYQMGMFISQALDVWEEKNGPALQSPKK